MSNIPRASSERVVLDVAPEVDPPYTYRLCGRVTCSPADGCLAMGETACTVGTVVNALWGATWAAGVFGVCGVFVFSSHYLVRKYGSLSAVVERFREVQERLIGEIRTQGETAIRLNRIIQESQLLNRAIESENGEFLVHNQKLLAEVTEIKAALEQLKKEREELSLVNRDLAGKMKGLAEINEELRTILGKLDPQTRALAAGVKRAAEVIPELQGVAPALASAVETLDQRFDEDLDRFDRQVNDAKKLTDVIQKQSAISEEQNRLLREQNQAFQQDEQRLEAEMSQLVSELEQTMRTVRLPQDTSVQDLLQEVNGRLKQLLEK